MSNLTKLTALLISLNIFMYVGLNFARSADGNALNEDLKFYFEGDLLDRYMQKSSLNQIAEDTMENWTNYAIQANENATLIAQKGGGKIFGTGGISFLDSLDIVWDFIQTLMNIIVSPLALLFNFRMPVLIGLMVGIPYFLILAITIFAFIRGVSD